MSSTPEDLSGSLNGLAKRVFGGLEHTVPTWAKFAELFKFEEQDKIGDEYQETVQLRRPQGHTHAGGASAGTAFTLNDARPGQYKPARVNSCEYVLREQVAYGAASKAAQAGEAAFASAYEEIMFGMQESAVCMRELRLGFGGSEIGILESVSGSSTTRVWTITKASWAPGIWSQLENAELDCYATDLTTQRNSNATIVITATDCANATRTVSVSGNATDLTACVAGDYLVPRGWIGNAPTGLKKQLTNTGSLFGIDAATYGMWKATSYNNSSTKGTFSAIVAAATAGVGRGLLGNALVIASHFTFADLSNDSASLRRLVENTGAKLELGTEAISYHAPNGRLDFHMHPMMPAGECWIVRPSAIKRGGSSDWTFNMPGVKSQKDRDPTTFGYLSDKAGFEIRGWMDDFILLKRPASAVRMYGILNQSLGN